MAGDERTLSVEVSLNGWDLFWVRFRGLQPLALCIASSVMSIGVFVSLSYALIGNDHYLNYFIAKNMPIVIGMALVIYAVFMIFCTALGAWLEIKKLKGSLDCEYSNRTEGLFGKSSKGEGLSRWAGLRSVKMRNNALYVVTSANLVHVIRACDVGSRSVFQEFSELAVERFRQAKEVS